MCSVLLPRHHEVVIRVGVSLISWVRAVCIEGLIPTYIYKQMFMLKNKYKYFRVLCISQKSPYAIKLNHQVNKNRETGKTIRLRKLPVLSIPQLMASRSHLSKAVPWHTRNTGYSSGLVLVFLGEVNPPHHHIDVILFHPLVLLHAWYKRPLAQINVHSPNNRHSTPRS